MFDYFLLGSVNSTSILKIILFFGALISLLCIFLIFSLKSNKRVNTSFATLKDINLEKLLGRESIKLDIKGIREYLKDASILITGAGGSIGSELTKQIARFSPCELILLDIYENNVYELQQELVQQYPNIRINVLIACIKDKKRLSTIFKEYRPEIIFHAAAHKHVPLMEENPIEAIKNNIFGTLNLVQLANKYSVKSFVLISTDKAVNPSNIMGATKRVCEMIVQAMSPVSNTKFVAVRFGNVLGSNGSVIPLFLKQISAGGPVTVTDKYVTRYFMLVSEATQLVLQAGAFAKGGEIFVLDMGTPLKIYDLAHSLIKMSGFTPLKEIEIEITGLRPGEKLHEELFTHNETLGKTSHDKIFVCSPEKLDFRILRENIFDLEGIVDEENTPQAIKKLKEIIPNYKKITNSN